MKNKTMLIIIIILTLILAISCAKVTNLHDKELKAFTKEFKNEHKEVSSVDYTIKDIALFVNVKFSEEVDESKRTEIFCYVKDFILDDATFKLIDKRIKSLVSSNAKFRQLAITIHGPNMYYFYHGGYYHMDSRNIQQVDNFKTWTIENRIDKGNFIKSEFVIEESQQ